jgi:ribonuclease H / adenosylcobalamin/alpha-ribazole phosphatase
VTERVIVEADGGSRGNPGPAGFGAVVRAAASGEVLAERQGGLGNTTNNVAEYEGLIAGLEAAIELGATDVEVRMDSKLVIEQMSGRWRVKHANLRPLALKASGLVRSCPTVRFEWIPRARNAHADRLANEAMDRQAGNGGAPPRENPAPEQGERAGQPPHTKNPRATGNPGRAPGWTGAKGAPTRLLMLRHGQTELSIDRRYSGRGDVPLTDLGHQQVQAAAKRVASMEGVLGEGSVAPVLSSPLQRTRQTARAVADALGSEPLFHDGLLETDFGEWEGLTFLEAAERDADLHRRWLSDSKVDPPGGESLEAVFKRVRAVRDEIVDSYAGRTLVVVSHVTPIKALLRLGLDGGPSLFYRLYLDLASLSIVEFYPDGNSAVRLVNDISHLG